MGFMDDVMGGVSQFTKGAQAKVKGNYDVVNRMAQINSVEKEVNGMLLELGRAYYQSHCNDGAAECQELINNIKLKYNIIENLKKENEETKESMSSITLINTGAGRKTCTACGASIKADNMFCPECGAKVEEPAAAPAPAVEASVEAATPAPAVEAPVEAAAPAPAVEAPVAAQEYVFCSNCGTKVESDTVFCPECGSKIE